MDTKYYGTEAILLASRDWGEADRLLTFYTKDLGRIDAVAKGVRLAKSKLRGHLTLYSRSRIMVTPGRGLWRLLDAEALSPRNGEALTVHSEEFARFFMRAVPEREENSALWEALEAFPAFSTPKELLLAKILVLKHMGMLPGESELGQFFSPRFAAVMNGVRDDMLFLDTDEIARVRRGINAILGANHMVQ